MKTKLAAVLGIVLVLVVGWLAVQENQKANRGTCHRFAPGSAVAAAPDLYSKDGFLFVNLSYNTSKDAAGRTLYCFTTSDGKESPTFHVLPGDHLIVTVKNKLPKPTSAGHMMKVDNSGAQVCGATTSNASSVNIHYHGTNVSPACHSDEVIHTLINSGQTFTYDIGFPVDEPPGLYWYHPHVHGLAESAVLGGASGALVVEGIEDLQQAVRGLPERILTIRDQVLPHNSPAGSVTPPIVPEKDLSVNYVPVSYPNYVPAELTMKPGKKEFWRITNSSADTVIDLELQYDGVPQELQLAGRDGVPAESQDGTSQGKLIPVKHIVIPPAARAEFIVQGPSPNVKKAQLVTQKVDTGPDGDSDPARPLIAIHTDSNAAEPSAMPLQSGAPGPQRFNLLATTPPTTTRTVYFSEINNKSQFFVTVDGATPKLFSPTNPPAITTKQGSVEDWTLENRSRELHTFHIHQIHFFLLERNGAPAPVLEQQVIDTVDIPAWSGAGPYPNVKVRLDFRGADIGDYVYHCHILEHEDDGMMATIRVLPRI
ncbi:MAG: Multicopper oxidase [Candidatus Saccharibacteria bacterium]|nr:Multicopper oxidase [Candidatus Saccharibacteria bacterium]